VPNPGRWPSLVQGVEFFRADAPSPVTWVLYEACIIFVVQGAKRGRLGERDLRYSAGSHLVLPLSVPLQSAIEVATPEHPFLAVTISIDPRAIAALVFEGTFDHPDPAEVDPVAVGQTDPALDDALGRLLRSLEREGDRRVLTPMILREIKYRILSGPHGALLRAAARETGTIAQVGSALAMIHERFAHPLSVGEMARTANMAESTFYAAFRDITGTTPIQHLKDVRLNRARQLLEFEGASVSEAARRTGYRSRSQFSRDFSSRFEVAPSAVR